MTEKNRIRGKKARAAGQRFELKVRKDLESKGWIVSKWQNNVELPNKEGCGKRLRDGFADASNCGVGGELCIDCEIEKEKIKLVPAKRKFNPFSKAMMLGSGFPDFIAFFKRKHDISYVVHGVEVKSGKYLDKIEKEKCAWLLDNNIFSKILIASKGEKRGTIKYVEFKEK